MDNSSKPDQPHKARPVTPISRPEPNNKNAAGPVRPLLQPVAFGLMMTLMLFLLTILALSAGRWLQETGDVRSTTQPVTATGFILPASAYARQDRLLVGVNDRFNQLNPLYAAGDGDTDAVALIFESLIRIDSDGDFVGQLARSWSYDEQTHQLTVLLRADHTFRDGRVLTAEDVVYTYEALLSTAYDGPLKGRLTGLQRVIPGPDDQTVLFQYDDQVTSPDLRMLLVGILKSDYYPYRPERIFELRDGNLYPEGSGAFYLEEHSVNHVVLQLRPGYAGQIQTVEIRQVASEAKYRLLQETQLDIVRNTWDVRMQHRSLSLPGYAFHPYATSVESYFLVNPLPRSQQVIQRPSQRLAVLLTVAGRPLSALQASSLTELENRDVLLYYFQGVDRDVLYENREKAERIAAVLHSAGLHVILKAAVWPELADRAAHHDYDLLLLPATANSRLPEHAVLMDQPVQPGASALVTGYREEVLIVCRRLSQVTINTNKHPFAASAGSWTDRIENIRVLQPDEIQEDFP